MTAISESYVQIDLGNEIFKVTRSFVAGSLVVSTRSDPVANPGSLWEVLPGTSYTEIGGGFIRISPALAVGTQVKFGMETAVTGVSSEADLLQKVTELQTRLVEQEKVLKIVLAALDERVSKHSFRVWVKAMEKSFGAPVILPDLFGIEGVNPYQ